MGQEVKTLMDSRKEAGTYRVIWDGIDNSGSQIASGIYICHTIIGDQRQSIKIVYVK